MKLTVVLLILATFATTNAASVYSEEYIHQLLESSQANVSQIVAEIQEYVINYEKNITDLLNAQKKKVTTSKDLYAEKLERNFQRNVDLLSSLSNPYCTDNVEFEKFDDRLHKCYVNVEHDLTKIFDECLEKLDELGEKSLSLQYSLSSYDKTEYVSKITKIRALERVKNAKETRKDVKANAKEIGLSFDQERKTLLKTFVSCQKTVLFDQVQANVKLLRAAKKCSLANSDKVTQKPEENLSSTSLVTDNQNQTLELEETTAAAESETAFAETKTPEVEETTAAETETPEVEETTAAETETPEVEETTAAETETPEVEETTAEEESTDSAESEEGTESSIASEPTEEPDEKSNSTTEDFWGSFFG